MRILYWLTLMGSLLLTPVLAQNSPPSLGEDRMSTPSSSERSESMDRVSVPAGTQIVVRTDEAIDSTTAREDQTFPGSVQEPVTGPDGQSLIAKGAPVQLIVRKTSSGSTTASPQLALGLESIEIGGHRYRVDTSDLAQGGDRGIGKNRRTGEYVGGGAVLGTLLGAIAGGGKGAAIGAVAGAAAGGTVQVLTKGKEVKVPAETTLRFRLDEPLNLRASDR